jgi:RHS repeat-associated protein
MGWFQMYNPTIAVTHTVYENVLKNQRIHLSSHHLYGSSRLGTKDYKPGQHYMYWDFAGPTVIADTSSLTTRRPWYSMVYNDAVQGLALSPYGMTDNTKYQVQHLVGQKQYELSNHLGNVQATISDLPVKVGEAHTEYHAPALPAVYDYYPFGMLMPDRYTSDTSSECVTVSQTKWVTTWVTHCYVAAEWVWPGYTSWGSVSVSTSSGLQISAGENSGVQFDVEVLPFEQQDVYLQIEGFYSGSGTFELQEYHNGQWTVLGSASFDKIGEVRITCRPRQAMVRAILRGPYYILAKQLCVTKPVLSQETVLVDICDTDGDKYRFGFNGQEKVNEWSGVGNYNDFLFRGQDSRIGRFLSVDPVASDYPWNSPYAFAENNVIEGKDLEGREYKSTRSLQKGIDNTAVQLPSDQFVKSITEQKQPYVHPSNFPQSEIRQGGIEGTKDYMLFKANYDTYGRYLPGLSDIEDGFNMMQAIKEGNYKLAAMSAMFLLPGGDVGRPVRGLITKLGKEGVEFALKNSSRLQHAFKHAKDIKQFAGKNWNKEVAQEWKAFNADILSNATKSFDNVLGKDKVKGFYKQVDGQDIATYVYKEGDRAGEIATTVVLTQNQTAKFGLR